MKPLLLVCVVVLAGCQSASKPGPVAANDNGDGCKAQAFANLVGTPGADVDDTQFPAGTRVLRPGMVMTMDYRGDRLNIVIGESGKVERVHCG